MQAYTGVPWSMAWDMAESAYEDAEWFSLSPRDAVIYEVGEWF